MLVQFAFVVNFSKSLDCSEVLTSSTYIISAAFSAPTVRT